MTPEAKAILRDAIEDAGYSSYARFMRDVGRGKVAAEIVETWPSREQFEVVSETDYVNGQLLHDVIETMKCYGWSNFPERCRVIGERVVHAAMQYILSIHEVDAEEIEAQIERNRQDYEEEERRSWRRDRYDEP